MNYDIGGDVVWSRGPTGTQGNASYQSGTNFAAPSALTVGSLMESLAYSTFGAPSSVTGPNGAVAGTSYDSYGRIAGTATATGLPAWYLRIRGLNLHSPPFPDGYVTLVIFAYRSSPFRFPGSRRVY